ncbi:SDR family NAD(P)-dependent oxidoreductase [uncultured Aquimarina sp.]|uniref:SDR family NAD(P)-dependent oxidoreductase n=1 Tax=uncultured Aquimarina sp. TaxID=575652 RepID=UPI002609F34B|nr:SDR family NAD(P)-dependent oxidoreductase [uncultured Aquimarina sp.]
MKEKHFISVYSGKESFLEDHKVNQEKVFPGAAYLELAREAGTRVLKKEVTEITEIIWLRPFFVSKRSNELHTKISFDTENAFFEIFTKIEDEEITHCRGRLNTTTIPKSGNKNAENIRKRLSNSINREESYDVFGELGLTYGPSLKGIHHIYYNHDEVLTRISVPNTENCFLSIGVLDSAFQSSIGFELSENHKNIQMPYSIEKLSIYEALPESIWCHIKKNQSRENIASYDISLFDDQYEFVRIKKFVPLTYKASIERQPISNDALSNQPTINNISYTPVWNSIPSGYGSFLESDCKLHGLINLENVTPSHFLNTLKKSLVGLGKEVKEIEGLSALNEEVTDVYLLNAITNKSDKDICNWHESPEREAFNVIKFLLNNFKDRELRITVFTSNVQKVFPGESMNIFGSGLPGLIGSLSKENPRWRLRFLDIDNAKLSSKELDKILRFSNYRNGEVTAYRKGHFYQKMLCPLKLSEELPGKIRKNGTYVILGGAGGIGKVTSEYLLKNYDAQLIWLGRSKIDDKIESCLKTMEEFGSKPIYIQCDVNEKSNLQIAYDQIKEICKGVNGLIHSAIVLNDKLLVNMNEDDFTKAYLPKSIGTHNFIDAFKDESLDFVCFYSSVQSFWNAAGQSNYSAGCTFKDSYANYIRNTYNIPSYTINWGYWGEVGIVRSKTYQDRMKQLGIESVSANEGMKILELVLSNNFDQVAAVKLDDKGKSMVENIMDKQGLTEIARTTFFTNESPKVEAFQRNESIEKLFREICLKGVLQVLLQLGIDRKTHKNIEFKNLRSSLGILDLYDRLFNELIREIKLAGYARLIDDKLVLDEEIKLESERFSLTKSLKDFVVANPSYSAYAKLLKACLESFNSIWTGTIISTDVLFPSGDIDLVGAVYKDNYQATYFNELLAETTLRLVKESLEQNGTEDKVRILEIGAGTGGTSQYIFEKLEYYLDRVEYCYSDISKSFLIHAEDTFKSDVPHLSTAIFDIERNPIEQNLPSGYFDIVIGANVIHATKNIKNTLHNIKNVTKKGGILLLNELASTELFSSITFGLLEGWWSYEDEEIRLEGSPGLSPENWIHILQEVGYEMPKSYPEQYGLPQQIVLAKSDGKVLLPLVSASKTPSQPTSENLVRKNDKTNANITSEIVTYLIQIFSRVLKLEEHKINPDISFDTLGIDSILIGELTKEFSKDFLSITTTNFFEYQNIKELSTYFFKNHLDHFTKSNNSLEPSTSIGQVVEEDRNMLPNKIIEPKVSSDETQNSFGTIEDIAIVGLSGRYPEARNMNEFWENLKLGKDSITLIPKDRWNIDDFYNEEENQHHHVTSKYGGFIDGISEFDPLFFNISPKEAELMDPQERLFLQTVWEAIEDSGYKVNDLSKRSVNGLITGVYVGVMYEEYQLYGAESTANGQPLSLGGSPSSIANRVSYFCDFNGPSMAVDTMCSSSLTAIHLACNDLLNETADVAIAGGVNISIHPNKYLMLSQSSFLSKRGKCESFGSKGSGFIPGEGVGAIVLKKLSQAERDNDQIYGVIKGTALNHGGKTHGYTVPNPNAQAEVIKRAIQKSKINVEDFSYIEAHGTGTSLGDPIEISGLIKAFQSDKKQFCSIGSIKSNIGHCESAAGIAGVTKVLLQLKYKSLVPSLHSAELNPEIDFENSPFKVQQKLQEWKTTNNKPRLAGVSSFGAGGSNAHIIIEEYKQEKAQANFHATPLIILLSAKNLDGLKNQVVNLKEYLLSNKNIDLHKVAYTLQEGRQEMFVRLALIVQDREDLLHQLSSCIDKGMEGRLFGDIRNNKLDLFLAGNAGEAYLKQAIADKEIRSIAQLWVLGVVIDWGLLYADGKPDKISLPTYPFAKSKYWYPKSDAKINNLEKPIEYLHPLLHTNSSSFNEQKFTSFFTGKEDFFQDHKVHGDKILSGVAYIELARKAAQLSIDKKVTSIRDLTWVSPIKVEKIAKEVQISLWEDGDDIVFEVYSETKQDKHYHSHGIIGTETPTVTNLIDINELKSGLTNSKSGAECYDFFNSMGLYHGPSFQGIQNLFYNEEESLSKISLAKNTDYLLTPGVLDSALQTCVGFSFASGNTELFLPFSVKEITIYDELPKDIWCLVRKAQNQEPGVKMNCYNIYLLDENGRMLISFSDFVTLPVSGLNSQEKFKTNDNPQIQLYNNAWKTSKIVETSIEPDLGEVQEMIIVLGDSEQLIYEKLEENLSLEVKWINESTEERCFLEIFELLKEITLKDRRTNLLFVSKNSSHLNYEFLSGLLKSVTQENPKINFKTIGVDSQSFKSVGRLVEIIIQEKTNSDAEVRYSGIERKVKVLHPLVPEPSKNSLSIKEGGVYIITGGTGGLGRIFSRYIDGFKDTKIVLTGRRNLISKEDTTINEFQNASYLQCDVANKESVETLINEVKKKYGRIDGIIHSAGITRDNLIINKTHKEISEVFASKITGTKNIDEVTKNEKLDFVVFFSSIAGVFGNIGQCDYASANAYMDHYANYRNKEKVKGNRYGHTISINWPVWEEGGMKVTMDKEELRSRWGIIPLPEKEGILSFIEALNTGLVNVTVVYGVKSELEQKLINSEQTEKIKKKNSEPILGLDIQKLKQLLTQKIKSLVSELLKLDSDIIRITDEFGSYGFDSVSLTKLSNHLNGFYNIDLTPTVFFNHPTIDKLSNFLLEDYQDEIFGKYEVTAQKLNGSGKITENTTGDIKITGKKEIPRYSHMSKRKVVLNNQENLKNDPVAIIGVSGRFPGSSDINSFWNNLKENKDMISEIPSDRWDWEKYYGNPLKEKNKTRSKWGGFIKDIDKFDPLFFGISPLEAELMDPQQRITLETVYASLEDAGISLSTIKGSNTGVFIGCSSSDYNLLINQHAGLINQTLSTTGNSHSVLVNRISYLLDIHGPSEPIDTACSSSLIAIHRAVENIRSGNCEMAFAGGVNALLSPVQTLSFSQAGVLSEDGRCKTFDQNANGYVRGEGVGVVLLKKLSKAEADGDHIYGVIRGTAENHGGRANSMTSPNPNAQKDLLVKAYEDANIDPRHISYIEAHGTGTPLGDPIETEGLKLAFKKLYKQRNLEQPSQPFCALGSVKTNIGHLEAAAGIAGVIKVLLSMKHNTIPGNPNLKKPNEYLQLSKSPFYLVKESKDWITDNNVPKIAGISSFGAGGSNAHIVIEEYIANKNHENTKVSPSIIILSAKNKSRLEKRITDLLGYLEDHSETNLKQLAYTLQLGREPMEHRVACIASTIEDLIQQLRRYSIDSEQDFSYGRVKKQKKDGFSEGESETKYIDYLIENKDNESLAQLWLKGEEIDWSLLYTDFRPNKISLPTYPFDRVTCWIPQNENVISEFKGQNKLHPLVHQNTSSLGKLKFTSVFSGIESFLKDHKVKGTKILPGVAYIELAQKAGELSLNKKITGVKDITWISPFSTLESPKEINIQIYEEKENICFEIFSGPENNKTVHTKGKLLTLSKESNVKKDINAIKLNLSNKKTKNECYIKFKELGIDYGSTFQGIEELHYNEDEALSKIVLPVMDGYRLSPGILDSALQTCGGFSFIQSENKLELPFSAQEITFYQELSDITWCHLKKNTTVNKKVNSYNIDLLNNNGELVLSFKNFTTLPIDRNVEPNNVSKKENASIQLYQSIWKKTLISHKKTDQNDDATSTALILVLNGAAATADYLKKTMEIEVIALNEDSEQEYVSKIIKIIQPLLKSKRLSDLTLLYDNTEYAEFGFIAGLLKTLQQEKPGLKSRLIGVNELSITNIKSISSIIEYEIGQSDIEVQYISEERQVKSFMPIELHDSKSVVFKEDGVYLVTGGMGGLGKLIANHISKIKTAKVIVVGRSLPDQEVLSTLSASGNVKYFQCDVAQKNEVISLMKKIKSAYNHLDGIIHCAGVIRDSLIENKTENEVLDVLSPKTTGVKNLDEVTKDQPLDFFALFSSVTAIIGNVGQADYSAANAYLDCFADERNCKVHEGKRIGKTVSINWPLWADGGIKMDPISKKFLKNKWGMEPLPAELGINLFESILKTSLTQVIPTFGDKYKIEKVLLSKKNTEADVKPSNSTGFTVSDIKKIVVEICSELLKINLKDIETEVEFSEYGVDSIMMIKVLDALESKFKIAIEPTAIVSYPTIDLISEYLISEIQESTAKDILTEAFPETNLNGNQEESPETIYVEEENHGAPKQVAIIGMSCKLPGSDSLEEFWEHLKSGKDLITDTPDTRWDPSLYYAKEDRLDKTYTTKGGFINDPGIFDAEYFGISDKEAISMDPQHRIALLLARDLFAQAGYKKEEVYDTKTGVYIGAKDNNYVRNNYHLLPEGAHQHTVVNNISNMIAARLSDFYNLKGKSQVIDTACSSSLVAIHQACEDILNNKVNLAIAGGVSIMVDAFGHIAFSQAKVLSREGKSFVFDERASGFVLGEGGALILLKDYESAKNDGDQILGIIKGSSVNNDGQTMGLTVPNKEGQKDVIKDALQKSSISPDEITYYEAHGTGTLLGDPIEIKAATEIYNEETAKTQYCALGSVKSNLGHNMTAAGVTGLIKILLQMKYKQLVPTLHCENPHPRFKFETSPFYPNTSVKDWNHDQKIAAISSFGFGGTNCHMIIEAPSSEIISKRKTLKTEWLSRNYYWLGDEIIKEKVEESTNKQIIGEQYSYGEPYLRDHKVNGDRVILGVTYLSLILDKLRENDKQIISLGSLLFKDPVILYPDEKTMVSVHLKNNLIDVFSEKSKTNQLKVAEGKIIETIPSRIKENLIDEINEVINNAKEIIEKDSFYEEENKKSIYQGDSLKVIDKIYVSDKGSVGKLRLPVGDDSHTYSLVHPALINGALVSCLTSISGETPFVPLMIKSVNMFHKVHKECICYGTIVKSNREVIEVDIDICSSQGEVLLEIRGFVCKRIPKVKKTIENTKDESISTKSEINGENSAENFIRNLLQKVVTKDMSKVSSKKNFMDMGIDSSELIQLVKVMEDSLEIELYPTLFFEYQNIAELAGYLSEHSQVDTMN